MHFISEKLLLWFFCGYLTYVACALSLDDSCSDEFAECERLQHLCNDNGTAGGNMLQFCKSTCKSCAKNKCLENNGGCEHLCHFVDEKNFCTCRMGFKLNDDLETCDDLDECADNTTACPGLSRKYCKNTVGSYTCDTCSHNDGYMMYYKRKTCCKAVNGTCGYDSTMASSVNRITKHARIYGGLRSEDGKWPWMVQLTSQPKNVQPQKCGGSLLSHLWVLTAAHCFWHLSTYPMQSWIATLGTSQNFSGIHRMSDGPELRSIAQVIKHPASNKFYHHDIALLKMDSPVEYSDVIKPICLPCIEKPQEGDICWTIGFGETDGKDSSTLQEVDLPIFSTSRCAKIYEANGRNFQQDHMICAGQEKGKDACYGDSGGPLMCQRKASCQWYQAGITSFGLSGCGLDGIPGVYTSVAAHQEWIKHHIGKEEANIVCPRRVCGGLVDESRNCDEERDFCLSYPDYMKKNCALTCCRIKHGIRTTSSCQDHPAFQSTCKKNIRRCKSLIFFKFMRRNCKRTCNTC